MRAHRRARKEKKSTNKWCLRAVHRDFLPRPGRDGGPKPERWHPSGLNTSPFALASLELCSSFESVLSRSRCKRRETRKSTGIRLWNSARGALFCPALGRVREREEDNANFAVGGVTTGVCATVAGAIHGRFVPALACLSARIRAREIPAPATVLPPLFPSKNIPPTLDCEWHQYFFFPLPVLSLSLAPFLPPPRRGRGINGPFVGTKVYTVRPQRKRERKRETILLAYAPTQRYTFL